MLKIDREKRTFSVLDTPTLGDVSITERYDLQEFISNSPEEFFRELGQELFLLGKEIEPSKTVQDRIDLLAVDKEGACVVVELKRGNHKLHMLQAISYAGMIAQWQPDECLELLAANQREALTDFLEVDVEDINRRQRVILIAESYDYAVLVGAEWLSEHHGVDITCCRIALACDLATSAEYLVCSNVFPAPELAKEAVDRGRRRPGESAAKWPDWEAALSAVTNDSVVSYFRRELANSRESYLRKRGLRYRVAGTRRWFANASSNHAYVWQEGRFEGDVEFWTQGLSDLADVHPVKDGKCLRFFLNTSADFQFFHHAVTEDLQSRMWLSELPEEGPEQAEKE